MLHPLHMLDRRYVGCRILNEGYCILYVGYTGTLWAVMGAVWAVATSLWAVIRCMNASQELFGLLNPLCGMLLASPEKEDREQRQG